ncbi:hypothetical protein QR680_011217 [Steinernema hermaphroditum]|uniref:DUF8206 domain-containing protein n=1 Tax=Steinernema hermaphroditum TaxID=289476 RepID=A0AA39IRH3_9BILA|nr:hypothetical protein QR680_011217 [Steinernema hermaphroditum]
MKYSVDWYFPDGTLEQDVRHGSQQLEAVVRDIYLRSPMGTKQHWARVWRKGPNGVTEPVLHSEFPQYSQPEFRYSIQFTEHPEKDALMLEPSQPSPTRQASHYGPGPYGQPSGFPPIQPYMQGPPMPFMGGPHPQMNNAFHYQQNFNQMNNAGNNFPKRYQSSQNLNFGQNAPQGNAPAPITQISLSASVTIILPGAQPIAESINLTLKPPLNPWGMLNYLTKGRLKKHLAPLGNTVYAIVSGEDGAPLGRNTPLTNGARYTIVIADKNSLDNNAIFVKMTDKPNPAIKVGSATSLASIPNATKTNVKKQNKGPKKSSNPSLTGSNTLPTIPAYNNFGSTVSLTSEAAKQPQKKKKSAAGAPSGQQKPNIPNMSNLTFSEPENTVDFDNADLVPEERAPFTTIPLSIPCPNAGCTKDKKTWNCVQCEDPLVYGFDDFVYCKCGRLALEKLRFKCSDRSHKRYLYYPGLAEQLRQIPLNKYNILVLGASGVGKSTWINSLMNYITYSTFDEACQKGNKVHAVIPARARAAGGKEFFFGPEDKDNEVMEAGKSATQKPKAYAFMFEGSQYTIIDVPGFSDSRGDGADKANVHMVMQELQNYEEIHAICFLGKSNVSRLTPETKYVLGSLTTQLHKESVKNLLFCFTSANRGMNSAGDYKQALQDYFNEVNRDNGTSVTLTPENMFYFENEAIEYLACDERGYPATFKKKKAEESFGLSQKQSKRLLQKVTTLPAHNTRKMLSINEARRIINTVTPILAKVTESIKTNEHMLQRQEDELNSLVASEVDTRTYRIMKQVTLTATRIPHPRTVCRGENCFVTIAIPNSDHFQIFYKKICHHRCYLSGVKENMVNDAGLRRCAAMSGENCRQCGHHWGTHLHIKCEQKLVEKYVQNPAARRMIMSHCSEKMSKEDVIAGLKEERQSLKAEEQEISQICAKFCWFLANNSLQKTNDAYEDVLVQAMETERHTNYRNGDKFAELEQSLKMYRQEKLLFEDVQKLGYAARLSEHDISALKDKLTQLRINGSAIKKNLDVIEEQDKNYERENVTIFDPKHPKGYYTKSS